MSTIIEAEQKTPIFLLDVLVSLNFMCAQGIVQEFYYK